jgi:hypothetical protein
MIQQTRILPTRNPARRIRRPVRNLPSGLTALPFAPSLTPRRLHHLLACAWARAARRRSWSEASPPSRRGPTHVD